MKSNETVIKIGDYVTGQIMDTHGVVKQVQGFVDFIAISHVQLHNGALIQLIPGKYQLQKIPNIVSIKYWEREQGLNALEG